MSYKYTTEQLQQIVDDLVEELRECEDGTCITTALLLEEAGYELEDFRTTDWCYPHPFPLVARFVDKIPCQGIQLYVAGAKRALVFTKENLRETRKKMDIALTDSELVDLIENLRKSENGPAVFEFLISKEFIDLIKLTTDDPRKACARAIPMSLEDRFDDDQKQLIIFTGFLLDSWV